MYKGFFFVGANAAVTMAVFWGLLLYVQKMENKQISLGILDEMRARYDLHFAF